MYIQFQNYRKYVIDGLYTVWLPPIPPHEEIQGWELKKEDQFWRRQPLPKFYEERRPAELLIQKREREMVEAGLIKKVTHVDPVLERYRRDQWKKRFNGVWFYNCGEPVYITGGHWFYLQWEKLDHDENDGYPLFYESQVDRYYFKQLCWEDPYCLGYLEIGARGFGKTSEEVGLQLENITRPPHNRHAALQSKTEADAQDILFKKKMLPMFNALPDFFKPEYNHPTDSERKFNFKRDSTQGKNSKKTKFGDDYELGNTVNVFSAKVKALDGQTLTDIINDEVGKTDPKKEANIAERTAVNMRCVWRNGRKRGLLRLTSTVEEMDKGGDQAYDVWNDSNPRERDANGHTTSKLYRLFVSTLKTQTDLADKYGRIPVEEAYKKIMNARKPVEDDPYKLSMIMRKDPLTEEEAFIKDQAKCIFNIFTLTKRIQELKRMKNLPGQAGFLDWVGQKDGDVTFVPKAEGDFRIWDWPMDEHKNRKIHNACTFMHDGDGKKLWLPCNDDIFASGGDPIKWIKTDDPRASFMAGHGFYKFDHYYDSADKPVLEWRSHNLLWAYHGRHEDPEEDYENIIKAMRYWGHMHMPESNINDFNKHLASRGYIKFRIVRRDFDKDIINQKNKGVTGGEGVQTVPEITNTYIRVIKQYITRHGMRCPDLPLLMQLRDFDPENPTKSDRVISLGYTLLACLKRAEEETGQRDRDLMKNIFSEYDISGHRSREIIHNPADLELDETDTDIIANEIRNSIGQ